MPYTGCQAAACDFYPRPPRGGRHPCGWTSTPRHIISIHALREEGDCDDRRRNRPDGISIHALREEGDIVQVKLQLFIQISIHALREEGDMPHAIPAVPLTDFYPRPPRGGRRLALSICGFSTDFYPRPPRGGRHGSAQAAENHDTISIHALREEGDRGRFFHVRVTFDFYPRPPRGGRLLGGVCFLLCAVISIHALREEGDSKNGEKHLRFCFIIKRSAQIWKSLSKNIRKKSRDLHRTA